MKLREILESGEAVCTMRLMPDGYQKGGVSARTHVTVGKTQSQSEKRQQRKWRSRKIIHYAGPKSNNTLGKFWVQMCSQIHRETVTGQPMNKSTHVGAIQESMPLCWAGKGFPTGNSPSSSADSLEQRSALWESVIPAQGRVQFFLSKVSEMAHAGHGDVMNHVVRVSHLQEVSWC